jgi:recombination protein RecA
MAKKKDTGDFFSELAEQTGGQVLEGSGDAAYFIDSGSLAVNYLCTGRFIGGGIPSGITEAYGPSSSAKTLWGLTLGGQVQKMGGYFILLDFERAANENFAKSAGHVDPKKTLVLTPNSYEDCQGKIMAVVQKIRNPENAKRGLDPKAPILFVWDSIGVTMCDREFRELKLPPNYSKEQYKKIVGGKEQPGERAKAAGTFLRKIHPFCDDHDVSLFVINQTREKIGVMFGNPETTAGGGKGLPFYANTRLRTSAQKKIMDTKRKIPLGVNLKVANKKSRTFVPFLETEGIQLYFNRGINPLGGLLTVLIGAGRVEAVKGGVYKINEPWAGGKEITFKANLARNDLDAEVLLQCPALVDAQDEEQVKTYLADFGEAIDLSHSADTAEVGVSDDDDESDEDKVDQIVGGESEEE